MKAIKEAIELLKFFKDRKNTRITTMIKVQSCIEELEALQSRSCDGCKYQTQGRYRVPCDVCARTLHDEYTSKEQ